ncbi:serine protease [Chlorobaculum sp. 24CR]|uniref:trypsin-like serine peptidase n=1 Tax=Chlorobaculum sp. 24CR TaxID=2508878 RepID=UPI00100B6850|nr:serine protease [Chlorobaculum sp. 24CR]RXK88167.1 serine protease [Chlorobaculum sp. 24CR]
MWQAIFILLVSFLLSSCTKKPEDPQTLYGKYRNSVVLIKNQYYYSIAFDNGIRLFFTLNEKGAAPEIYETEKDAAEHASTAFGTGFFVDRDGRIATNRHVVNPLQQGRDAAEYITKAVADFKQLLSDRITEKVNEQRKLKEYFETNYYALDGNAISNLRQQYAELDSQINVMKKVLQSIYFNPDNTEMQVHVMDIGVAYDNTYVTSPNDFQSCVVLNQSGDEAVDLAVIQLKNKHTPETITDLIPLLDEAGKSYTSPTVNDDVYMIGYNYGLLLAVTKDGIKSQFTAGKVTQEPDGNRMLYSIPTLPGSSGSPIIDQWGHLVAVNFAKISDTQSFSFGIPKQPLLTLLNSSTGMEPGIHTERVKAANAPQAESVPISVPAPVPAPVSTASPDSQGEAYRTTIRGFVVAEDSRDFDQIYGYFSDNLLRYWDMSKPSYDDLLKSYQFVWRKTSQSRNIITDIRKITDRTFDLYTEYEYYDLTKQKTISKSSRVRFHFDGSGKIDEVYGVQ